MTFLLPPGIKGLIANPIKWPNPLKLFGKIFLHSLSMFDHFLGLAVQGLKFKLQRRFKVSFLTFHSANECSKNRDRILLKGQRENAKVFECTQDISLLNTLI